MKTIKKECCICGWAVINGDIYFKWVFGYSSFPTFKYICKNCYIRLQKSNIDNGDIKALQENDDENQ